jgi:hypothetical protein
VTTNPIHWFVIRCGDSDLTVDRWNSETANSPGARHYSGEAHAEVYISRWFDSVCAPPKPSFTWRLDGSAITGMRNRLQRTRSLVGYGSAGLWFQK